ncbi:MAG: hypothetical protein MJ234_02380 [bacterium]|nr:hypothetical protein [bacterium]
MTIGPMNPGITNISNADFVRNAQHVGMQKEGVSKTQTEETQTQAADEVFISSQPGQTEEAGKAGNAGKTEGTQQNGKTEGTEETAQSGNAGKTEGTQQNGKTEGAAPAAGQAGESEEAEGESGCPSMEDGMPGAGLGSETSETGGASASQGASPFQGMTYEEQLEALKQMELANQQFQETMMAIEQELEKHWAKMLEMIQETQNAIYEIQMQVMQHQYGMQERIFMGWCGAICGGR